MSAELATLLWWAIIGSCGVSIAGMLMFFSRLQKYVSRRVFEKIVERQDVTPDLIKALSTHTGGQMWGDNAIRTFGLLLLLPAIVIAAVLKISTTIDLTSVFTLLGTIAGFILSRPSERDRSSGEKNKTRAAESKDR
jgi:hypothetical protein